MKSAEVRALLGNLGVRPTRSLGQHFLLDEGVAIEATEKAEISAEDTVLEIGPGLGVLTQYLASEAEALILMEKSSALARYLKGHFPRARVIEGDATRVPWPPFDRCVSNLPFNISSPVLFRLLDLPFKRAVLMVQWEFARRLVAPPGTPDYSRLTVKTLYRAECHLVRRVSRGSFWPSPRVDAALVSLEPRRPSFAPKDEALFLRLVDILFQHRRKQVGTILAMMAKELGLVADAWRAAPYLHRRPGDLTPTDLATLSDVLAASKG